MNTRMTNLHGSQTLAGRVEGQASSHSGGKHRAFSARGFTILEVMIAMGIFVIAFVAVAAIFPAGAYLQKQTMAEIQGKSVADSAKALLAAKPFSATTLDAAILPGASWAVSAVPGLNGTWPLGDRSFPSNAATPEEGSYFWVPLVRRTITPAPNANDWQVFVFVLRRDNNVTWTKTAAWANPGDASTVPGVMMITGASSGDTFTFSGFSNAAPRSIRIGDQILDRWGTIYLVKDVSDTTLKVTGNFVPRSGTAITATQIWIAPSQWPASGGDRPTPTLQIIGPITNAVK